MPPLPFDSIDAAYAKGVADAKATDNVGTFGAAQMYPLDIRDAGKAWRNALLDHLDTSYYGVPYIQQMRAYWIARRRAFTWDNFWARPRRTTCCVSCDCTTDCGRS